MKTIQLSNFGLDNLKLVNTEKPQPGAHDVLVKIEAASFNYLDLMMIKGQYNPKLTFPYIPCSDAAGVVESIGTAVTRWKKGDRVTTHFIQEWITGSKSIPIFQSRTGLEKPGVLSEYISVSEEALIATPANLSSAEASTLPIAGLTAWTGLIDYANLKPGQTILTQGTGGVSIFALQIAKAMGVKVIALSSTADKLARLKALGADEVINYKDTPAWHKEALRLTNGKGVDAILDVVGTDSLTKSVYAVKADGFVGLVGNLSGAVVPFNIYDTVPNNATLRGISVGSRESFEAFARAIELTSLKPVIDRIFPFDATPEAYRYMEGNNFFGKIVISLN